MNFKFQFLDILHVTCMHLGCISQMTFHMQPHCTQFSCIFWIDRVWLTLPPEDLVECSLVIFTSTSKFSCLAQPSLLTTYLLPGGYQRKSGSSYQRHSRQHNDGKVTSLGSLSGMPVKLSNGIADEKQQPNLHPQGSLGIQTGC